MTPSTTITSSENLGVYNLITDLCTKTASKYCNCNENRISQKRLLTKMRSTAYELILKKSPAEVIVSKGEPIADLLLYYFVYQQNVRNIAEYKRSLQLKEVISTLRKTDYGDKTSDIYNAIKFLVGLSNAIKEDLSPEVFQNPCTFGLLDEMLPKPKREVFGSTQPYSYFPSHVFELPFSLNRDSALDKHMSQTYTEYTVESFDSSPFLINPTKSQQQGQNDVKTFLSPMSMPSMTSTHLSPYSESTVLNYPRLTVPRDLKIPISATNIKISLPSTNIKTDEQHVSRATSDEESIDIWELVNQVDKDIPEVIWDIVSKLPKIEERHLINSSSREICLWREIYAGLLSDMDVILEKQFIRHIMYLIIGVETKSFPFSNEANCFYMKEDLLLEGISKELLSTYVCDLLLVGTYYRRLYKFAFNQSLEDHFHSNGLVYEAAREVVRRYLLEFRLVATEIYENCCKASNQGLNCMPTLLQILYHMEPLKYEIETMASIYKLTDEDVKSTIPHGAELMSYLFDEISLVTHKNTTYTVYNSFYTVCKVYFKFIERYIFEGELDDRFNEFFIRKDNQYVNCRSKRYWDKGFHITQSVAIPEFLKSLAKFILLCGKSLRLLKLCNPSDPLVLLISSDHPSVTCCASFEELERQQQVLDVYRTRCLFVSGELVTFDQILLKREAERKAFTEMASLKQAETMEKIVAERKRLAQLIIAEKQHSLRVLEAAMAEAKAAKIKAKQRERRRFELEHAAEKATEEIDSKLKDAERNKIMEYYSKLNMEVEKSKMHTEWKIKRLQLDQSRMQLLSTEERNLKREKLELEHQRNEEIMAMSIQSIENNKSNNEIDDNKEATIGNTESAVDKTIETTQSNKKDVMEISDIQESEDSTSIAHRSTVLNAICNVAKSLFRVSRSESYCDNNKQLDEQGNIVHAITRDLKHTTSSSDIGSKLDAVNANLQFNVTRQEALMNRKKVMTHEFGQIDNENNKIMKGSSLLNLAAVDEENNLKDSSPFIEAKRNKLKILGAEFDIVPAESKNAVFEPRTEAHKEAFLNKQKVLGVDYNLPAEPIIIREPLNQAQMEAVTNKQKVLGVDYNLPAEPIIIREPMNQAQMEAVTNKQKVLGVDYNLPAGPMIIREPVNQAQIEAVTNKQKVMGVEYNLPIEPFIFKKPLNQAQEEAVTNKQRVLGVEYNLAAIPVSFREPANEAQETAVRNKKKIMSSEYENTLAQGARSKESGKRTGLTLNLKPYGEASSMCNLGGTPNTGTGTPGDMFSRLDLETPTTADIQQDGMMTADVFTPHTEVNKDIESVKPKNKDFISSNGFNFSIMVDDENTELEITSGNQTADIIDDSPSKNSDSLVSKNLRKYSFFNILDGSYSLDDFDPFGVKDSKNFSQDHLTNKMDIDMATSCYTHPSIIMEEVKKRPYPNIFASQYVSDNEEEKRITCDNIATLTACLQRSVMLPLTYQLEVVNNSILTYFLMNLDMYEHLRSLKDYFFLMDGEFSGSICNNLFTKLVKTLNPQELLNFATLHNILDKALGSSISHVHKFSENLSFTITELPLSFQHSSPDVLQCLSLTYTVSWPLNIILSQEALLRYARVFQFLIKMRRIFWVLGEDFEALKLSVKLSKQHSRKLLKSSQYISVQLYRHIMASMIRALDNYIVTTCIHTSWKEFENDLKKARTLDDLYECHVVYIKKVLFRCLLNNRSTPVMKLLNDIFTVILKFSRVLKAGEWLQKEPNGFFTHTSFAQLEELFHLFEKLAKYLHKVVTKLMECGYQRHLVELLTMVNLNGYYDPEKSKEEQNSTVKTTV